MSEFINQPLNIGSGLAETTSIEVPPEKDVVFYNDDFTTMEFVVDVLVSVFNKSPEDRCPKGHRSFPSADRSRGKHSSRNCYPQSMFSARHQQNRNR